MTIENYNFNNDKTAISICAANRPEYFTQAIDSIYKQIDNRPTYVFLDITPDKNTKMQDEQANYALDKIPSAHIIKHQSHMGCGKNLIFAREYVFSYLRVARSFIIEDDFKLTPGYLDLCENMMDWTDKNYDNVGIVQAWGELAGKQKDRYLENKYSPFDVTACYSHWWSYLMSRKCWMQIRNLVTSFMEIFLCNIPTYGHRNHEAIMQWKHSIIQQLTPHKQQLKQNCQRPFSDDDKTGTRKAAMYVTGQDGITLMSLYMTNQIRVCPVLGRGKYIGVTGQHYNESVYNKHGFNDWKEYSTPEDATNKDFKEVEVYEQNSNIHVTAPNNI